MDPQGYLPIHLLSLALCTCLVVPFLVQCHSKRSPSDTSKKTKSSPSKSRSETPKSTMSSPVQNPKKKKSKKSKFSKKSARSILEGSILEKPTQREVSKRPVGSPDTTNAKSMYLTAEQFVHYKGLKDQIGKLRATELMADWKGGQLPTGDDSKDDAERQKLDHEENMKQLEREQKAEKLFLLDMFGEDVKRKQERKQALWMREHKRSLYMVGEKRCKNKKWDGRAWEKRCQKAMVVDRLKEEQARRLDEAEGLQLTQEEDDKMDHFTRFRQTRKMLRDQNKYLELRMDQLEQRKKEDRKQMRSMELQMKELEGLGKRLEGMGARRKGKRKSAEKERRKSAEKEKRSGEKEKRRSGEKEKRRSGEKARRKSAEKEARRNSKSSATKKATTNTSKICGKCKYSLFACVCSTNTAE